MVRDVCFIIESITLCGGDSDDSRPNDDEKPQTVYSPTLDCVKSKIVGGQIINAVYQGIRCLKPLPLVHLNFLS